VKLVEKVALVLGGALVLLLAWGLIEPYVIDETAYTVQLPDLPEGWVGSDVAVISDLQIGMWWDNLWTVRRIVSRIMRAEPDAVLILGDFIYHGGDDPTQRIETVVELLEPLTDADLPVVAVLGNHDYSVVSYDNPRIKAQRAEQLEAALQEIGIRVLENEATRLTSRAGSELYLVGSGSLMAGRANPAKALEDVPADAPRIALMHNPTTFVRFPAESAPLALAGHTHGGQFRLPFTPAWTWVTYFKEEEFHADGWIRDFGAEGNQLYVNRGIGFSLVPLRFNCPPELTWFTLDVRDS
jgi:hypothetical protein